MENVLLEQKMTKSRNKAVFLKIKLILCS